MSRTFDRAIAAIDKKLSDQLNAIMHAPKFTKLEGAWRGLHYLVMNSETGTSLKLRMLNVSKRELTRDLTKAVEFDQSQLFKKIYENEFGTPGGEPYGALIGDYEWTNAPDDVETLRLLSNVAASGFSPFVSAAGPGMFGFNDYTELSKPRDLAKIFETAEYMKWRSFRDSEDARFVSLVMPRVIARLPYGEKTKPIDEFAYEEAPSDASGAAKAMGHHDYCWMNAAYVMGARMTDAFAKTGFCVAIRGAEGGGKVENLPMHVFQSDDGDLDSQCPAEIGITDRREFELSNLGFLPVCHYKNTDYAVFFGSQTVQKPKKYDRPEATANAAISARLPYIMATGRFAHYLKVMARDKIGSLMEASDCEIWLNRWIGNYVNGNEKSGAESKMLKPLREARVEVREIPGKPGSYNAVAHLRPWLQLEELTTSMRLVASIRRRPERGYDPTTPIRLWRRVGVSNAAALDTPSGLIAPSGSKDTEPAPLRDAVLSGRFFGSRHAAEAGQVAELTMDDAGQALRRWFGTVAAAGLLLDRDVLRGALDCDIAAIDLLLSEQVDAILQAGGCGSWKGPGAGWRGWSAG